MVNNYEIIVFLYQLKTSLTSSCKLQISDHGTPYEWQAGIDVADLFNNLDTGLGYLRPAHQSCIVVASFVNLFWDRNKKTCMRVDYGQMHNPCSIIHLLYLAYF